MEMRARITCSDHELYQLTSTLCTTLSRGERDEMMSVLLNADILKDDL